MLTSLFVQGCPELVGIKPGTLEPTGEAVEGLVTLAFRSASPFVESLVDPVLFPGGMAFGFVGEEGFSWRL